LKRPLLLTVALFGWIALLGACSPTAPPTIDPLDLTGTPEAIVQVAASHTGRYLAPCLAAAPQH